MCATAFASLSRSASIASAAALAGLIGVSPPDRGLAPHTMPCSFSFSHYGSQVKEPSPICVWDNGTRRCRHVLSHPAIYVEPVPVVRNLLRAEGTRKSLYATRMQLHVVCILLALPCRCHRLAVWRHEPVLCCCLRSFSCRSHADSSASALWPPRVAAGIAMHSLHVHVVRSTSTSASMTSQSASGSSCSPMS